MPEEWRSVLIPIYKNKEDTLCCGSYRGIKLMIHTMKIWEKIIEANLGDKVEISEQKYGFTSGKGSTNAMFALRMLIKKYREGQRELYCVFVDLEKAYDRVSREELWHCIRNQWRKSLWHLYRICTRVENNGEVCSRNYKKFQGQGQIAPGISAKSAPVCSDYR